MAKTNQRQRRIRSTASFLFDLEHQTMIGIAPSVKVKGNASRSCLPCRRGRKARRRSDAQDVHDEATS
ncbi:hypothetical protein V1282_002699 [Nitrobacteraceae bacterium AZCC 2146]